MSVFEMIRYCQSALHDKQWDAKLGKDVNIGVWHTFEDENGNLKAVKCPMVSDDNKGKS